jgi:hypothetical protein
MDDEAFDPSAEEAKGGHKIDAVYNGTAGFRCPWKGIVGSL